MKTETYQKIGLGFFISFYVVVAVIITLTIYNSHLLDNPFSWLLMVLLFFVGLAFFFLGCIFYKIYAIKSKKSRLRILR